MSRVRGVLSARDVSKSYGATVVLDRVAGGIARFTKQGRGCCEEKKFARLTDVEKPWRPWRLQLELGLLMCGTPTLYKCKLKMSVRNP